VVSLCFPIFFHPDCTVGFGVSPNHALRLVGCTTGRESHPALKILDSISGSIIAWYIIECKPFLKPGQNRDGTTFRRRTLSRGLAPSSSLSFCQSFHRVFLQAAESDVFSKASLPHGRRNRLTSPAKKNRKFPMGNSLSYLSCVDFFRVRPIQGRPLFLFCPHSSAPWCPAAFHRRMQVVFFQKTNFPEGTLSRVFRGSCYKKKNYEG